jgi:hypothetical protein
MAFELVTTDGSVEHIGEADSYALEGPLTTFFVSGGSSGRLSSWSLRVASFRTDHIVSVRRVDDAVNLRAVG